MPQKLERWTNIVVVDPLQPLSTTLNLVLSLAAALEPLQLGLSQWIRGFTVSLCVCVCLAAQPVESKFKFVLSQRPDKPLATSSPNQDVELEQHAAQLMQRTSPKDLFSDLGPTSFRSGVRSGTFNFNSATELLGEALRKKISL